jgi:hypothetical protein
MSKILSRIGAFALMLGGMAALAFFRFTKFFGLGTSSSSELALNVTDLQQERVCRSPAQEVQFFRIQNSITTPGVNLERLGQANQAITELITQAEGTGPQRSAVLRATRMQICGDLGVQPYQEDVTYVRQTIQRPGYSPSVSNKIVGILDTMGIAIGRTKE